MKPPESVSYRILNNFFSVGLNSSLISGPGGIRHTLNISEIRRHIAQVNELQQIYNEDIYGPMQNDTVIIVIQASIAG